MVLGMMTLREQLIHIANIYAAASRTRGKEGGATMSTVSTRVFKDGKTLGRVIDGGDVTTGNFENAIRWFSANWPDGVEWPEAVERPAVPPVVMTESISMASESAA